MIGEAQTAQHPPVERAVVGRLALEADRRPPCSAVPVEILLDDGTGASWRPGLYWHRCGWLDVTTLEPVNGRVLAWRAGGV